MLSAYVFHVNSVEVRSVKIDIMLYIIPILDQLIIHLQMTSMNQYLTQSQQSSSLFEWLSQTVQCDPSAP